MANYKTQESAQAHISKTLSDAMKAVNEAKVAVAHIQNIAQTDSNTLASQSKATAFNASVAVQMTAGTLVNIVNSQNVQIGPNNKMFIVNRSNESSDSDDSEIEDPRELSRKCWPADEETAEILRDSHRQVSDAELQRLSRHIGGAWRRLIRLLDIDDADVDYIFHMHQCEGLEEVIYQLLKKWKQENDNPTIGDLIRVLEEAKMRRLLRHLKP